MGLAEDIMVNVREPLRARGGSRGGLLSKLGPERILCLVLMAALMHSWASDMSETLPRMCFLLEGNSKTTSKENGGLAEIIANKEESSPPRAKLALEFPKARTPFSKMTETWTPLSKTCLDNNFAQFDNDLFPATMGSPRIHLQQTLVRKLPLNKLEIGPFTNPILRGDPSIKYFEILNKEKLVERAKTIGLAVKNAVDIDYVHPSGDLSSIPDKKNFSLVVSSHVLEHQLDMVQHFAHVGELLDDGGYYFLIVPDKRFCFDHAIPESTIADVLDDHFSGRAAATNHELRSVIEHRALTQHNNAGMHWQGKHGPLYSADIVSRIVGSFQEYATAEANGGFVDVHTYQFTPQGLAFMVDILYELGLTDLRVHRLYETLENKIEFCLVLKKCSSSAS